MGPLYLPPQLKDLSTINFTYLNQLEIFFVLLVSGYQFCHIRGWREGLICFIFLTIVVINDFYFATGVY